MRLFVRVSDLQSFGFESLLLLVMWWRSTVWEKWMYRKFVSEPP